MSLRIPDCLVSVVGLTDTDCACFDDISDISKSGLYLDDAEYGFPLKIVDTITDCTGNDLAAKMEAARLDGINQFITDLGANILSGPMKATTEPFNGEIGDNKHTLNLTPNTYFGIRLEPRIFRGVVGKMHSITLYLSGVNGQDITVGLYDEDALTDGTPITTWTVSIAGGKGTVSIGTPYLFDFQTAGNQCRDMYLVINAGDYAGIQPRNNKFKCSCGKKEKWDQFFYAHGLTASTLEGLVDAGESSYANGFRVHMSVACGHSWLCQQFDYVNDPWARVMAECIALYGMKKLAGMILSNPYPEKYTMITREEIAFHRDRINTLLGQRMPWLAGNLPKYYQDCFACNDKVRTAEYLV